jgi:hypothetical protein
MMAKQKRESGRKATQEPPQSKEVVLDDQTVEQLQRMLNTQVDVGETLTAQCCGIDKF